MKWRVKKENHFWVVHHPNGINRFAFLHWWAARRFIWQQPRVSRD